MGFVSCIAIGDIFNEKQNNLVIVTADGWCYIYKAVLKKKVVECEETPEDVDTVSQILDVDSSIYEYLILYVSIFVLDLTSSVTCHF